MSLGYRMVPGNSVKTPDSKGRSILKTRFWCAPTLLFGCLRISKLHICLIESIVTTAQTQQELEYKVDERDWTAVRLLVEELEQELAERRNHLLFRITAWQFALKVFRRVESEKLVILSIRCNWWALMDFLLERRMNMAIIHFVMGMWLASKTVPTVTVNCLRHAAQQYKPWRILCPFAEDGLGVSL